jgi:uncharacterized protein
MAFTEIKKRKANKYFYRVLSLRQKKKVFKKRIYLGKNLSKEELEKKEKEADKEFYKIKRKRRGEFDLIKKKLLKLLKKAEIKKAGIFGSYARGEQKKNSDIDILIEPSRKISGFKFFDFQKKLSDNLGKKVDLITYKSLNHLIKERVLNQEVKII